MGNVSGDYLLSAGNQKLGQAIMGWSIPAVLTCPGATELCKKACYARRHRFQFQRVRDRLQWNYEQSLLPTFVERMVEEIKTRGVLVLRVHIAGDFYDAAYAEKWLAIMKQCPRVRFYGYTRSWRVPEIMTVLEKIAALRCARLWLSVDAESGLHSRIPPGSRLAYLQVTEGEGVENVDLVFRTRKLRALLALPIVCSAETPEAKGTTCGSCTRCFFTEELAPPLRLRMEQRGNLLRTRGDLGRRCPSRREWPSGPRRRRVQPAGGPASGS